MTQRILTTLAILAPAALPALAKPNFTGDWKLNASKSTFGEMPAPDSMTYKITHTDTKLVNATKQSSQMVTSSNPDLTTDGKDSTNEGFQGSTMKSMANWDGDTLVIATKGTFGDNEITMTQKWSLSTDGKTLTVAQSVKSPQGEFEVKYVLDKQ